MLLEKIVVALRDGLIPDVGAAAVALTLSAR